MKTFLMFISLTLCLSLSEQSLDFISHGGEEAIVEGKVSVPRSPPADYHYVPEIGYYKFVDYGETFNNALQACEKDGAHLAILNSIEEASALVTIYKQYNDTWRWPRLGFGDFFENGKFRTIFGETMSSTGYTYWAPGEPILSFERNCGCMNRKGEMGAQCCDCGRPYFCEIELSNRNFSN